MPLTSTDIRHHHTTRLLTELDREWVRLRHRPSAMRRVRRWSGDDSFEAMVRSVGSLDDLVAATQPVNSSHSATCDAILGRLVDVARTDELAGRVVLQRILPGLISRSRRWRRHVPGGDPTDVAIGAAWIAIRRFDVTRRHRHLAPALIADALWVGFRRDTRRMATTAEVPVAQTFLCDHAAATSTTDPMVALAATLRAADRAGVRSADLAVIRSIAAAGSPTRAATECRVTVRTIRNRRDVATRRIRRALGPDWDDWSDPLAVA